jgi:hypothetical protein
VNEAFVPVRGVTVHSVEVDGEAVLLDEVSQRLHLLNATGALLWACFDGESSIGEIVTDLSDELGAVRAVVLADTLEITRHLGEEGLLANLEPPRPRPDASVRPEDETPTDTRFVPEQPDP